MELIQKLFLGFPEYWGGGVAHSVLILSLVIAIGLLLSKVRIANVSLGLSCMLFIGIVFGHFNMNLNENLLHFMREFGLILFVYTIGIQVGPGFFSSFKRAGLSMNMLAVITILLSILVTVVIYSLSDTPITLLAGILSGAVTNTPGLGAAQEVYAEMNKTNAPDIAIGYAVTYPMGVIGLIISFLILRFIMRVNVKNGSSDTEDGTTEEEKKLVKPFSVIIKNNRFEDKTLAQAHKLINRNFVVSRILHADSDTHSDIVSGETKLHLDDKILIIANPKDMEAIIATFGMPVDVDWDKYDKELTSRKILITKTKINGKTLAQLKIRSHFGANITRISRSGVELVASPSLQLQMGDRVTVVGSERAINQTEKMLGNSIKRLDRPNLIPIFIGIALGCILAIIPISIPGISHPLKLGLTGGPLVVAILIGYFGPKYKLTTFNTTSASLMLREIGICIFLACVGLDTGKEFFNTVINMNGLTWVGYGVLITMTPILIGGLIGRYVFHLNYYSIIGALSGANTNPIALSYANDLTQGDCPAVGYATVYPFAMFLRIIIIQILILILS